MRLSYLPGKLTLEKGPNGEFRLEVDRALLGTFAREKPALNEYNRLRRELESKRPSVETTDEEKRKLLQQDITDGLLGHNSLRPPRKRTAKSRTFG